MNERESLLALARALPPGAAVSVPREWLLEFLEVGGPAADAPADSLVDLTVENLATRFGKAPSTIRAWCERGDFPGAYRRGGKEWRIPAGAVAAYQVAQRSRIAPSPRGEVDLGAWRNVRKAS